MTRHFLAAGLGAALAFSAVPATAQGVYVDVGVHSGPVSGRVVYASPEVYPAPHYPYPVDYPIYDRAHAHRRLEYERVWDKHRRKSEREYWKDVQEFEREQAKAQREAEREYWKDVREFERERAKDEREYERERRQDWREAERERWK